MLVSSNKDMKLYQTINLCNSENGEMLEANIISKMKFDDVKSMLDLIPYDWFGEFKSKRDAIHYFTKKNLKKIYTYRLKVSDFIFDGIGDEKLIELIDLKSIEKDNLGYSVSNVFKVKLKLEDKYAILKIQTLSSRTTLEDEYKRLKWLEERQDIPKIYYWNKIKNKMYLLMEFKEGTPSCDCEDIGFQVGKKLKDFHNIDIKECKFTNSSVDIILKKCMNNIDSILPQVKEILPGYNKEKVIEFLEINKPKDVVVIHGDYSLPNILISEKEINLIDLRDLSISTKYYDLYYAIKSFERNNKENEIDDFLRGYGISQLEDKYMKWMEIVDKSIYF